MLGITIKSHLPVVTKGAGTSWRRAPRFLRAVGSSTLHPCRLRRCSRLPHLKGEPAKPWIIEGVSVIERKDERKGLQGDGCGRDGDGGRGGGRGGRGGRPNVSGPASTRTGGDRVRRRPLLLTGAVVAAAVVAGTVAARTTAPATAIGATVSSGTAAGQPSAQQVRVEGGLVSGAVVGDILTVLGIPYAAPPVGELRWRPPQPVIPWEGARPAHAFGPECPQPPPPAALSEGGPVEQSEDCLFLNIWTQADLDGRRPVMVWIHGGGFRTGAASNRAYHGAALAAKGVVFVSINYRLGPLGFFAHPELSAESEHGASGNYGLLDQIAALRWVQRNIAAFGGDPERVTIFGESAGSSSVSALMASSLAAGLFHRAIGQSGALFDPMRHLKSGGATEGPEASGLPSAEANGLEFARAAGVESLAALRALPPETIIERAGEFARGSQGGRPFGPIVDGHVLADDVRAILAAGAHSDVPLIVGFNADEMTTLTDPAAVPVRLEDYREWVRTEFGEMGDEFYRVYRTTLEELGRTYLDAQRDLRFGIDMRDWARAAARGESKVFFYFFTHAPPILNKEYYGAHHGAEIIYALNNLHRVGRRFPDAEYELAAKMSDYWVNFAATGDPNGDGLPLWFSFEPDSEFYLEIGDRVRVGERLLEERLDFIERFLGRNREP
jgi:para-nitrobenzyl esterase